MKIAEGATMAVVGAGVMGAGIAQVAAQAGHPVRIFDSREGAADASKAKLSATLDKLVAKGKFSSASVAEALARITPVTRLAELAPAALVIEAIVENLAAKHEVLVALERVVSEHCVLASNTSSISITEIAARLQHPGRVVGMHFFNPVPIMKLVEVVSGLETTAAVADAVQALATSWGKSAVRARSTPGFIVNRIARPFYAEGLALLQERALTPAVLDACVRGAGFRMGPCELMDLIGHDTNFAVTGSVYNANFGDKRFVPSLVQRELVEGGLLGRKSGRGFYQYPQPKVEANIASPGLLPAHQHVCLYGNGAMVERWAAALRTANLAFDRVADADWGGLDVDGAQLRVSDGRPALQLASESGCRDMAVCDATADFGATLAPDSDLAYSMAASASVQWCEAVPQWLAVAGFHPQAVADAAGLVTTRTVAMLINEAADAVQQGVCDAPGADTAMRKGVNYPAGPFEWLERWGARRVVAVLDHLADCYRGERYRVSPWLRRRAWEETLQ